MASERQDHVAATVRRYKVEICSEVVVDVEAGDDAVEHDAAIHKAAWTKAEQGKVHVVTSLILCELPHDGF